MALGVLPLQPPPCTPATWKLARDQVWRDAKDRVFSCLLIVVLALDNLQRNETLRQKTLKLSLP